MSGYEGSKACLTPEEVETAELLLACGQDHLMANWPASPEDDDKKKQLLAQCKTLDGQVPGGLKGYVERAKQLLEESRAGVNPYDGYSPEVPQGARLETQTEAGIAKFADMESKGMEVIGKTAFCMVAGGLGERLGYNGIKIELPSEITTETSFMGVYAQSILAFQERARAASGDNSIVIPLAIMTSGDTDAKTRALLKANNNFGMAEGQIIIVKQELVPALLNNDAHFATEDPYTVSTKPQVHGDVHTLLFQSGLSQKWADNGMKYVVFFQDTNGLVFKAVPASLGVSVDQGLVVNSLTVPRRPGEAVGAITTLVSEAKGNMTINVEYNQVEALMKETGKSDEPDETGFSPYPGNINVLVFEAQSYAEELKKSQGVISEFVNPKYADAEKTTFKKPTRLECMMQDYPKLLDSSKPVGFVQMERWTSFSAVKNNTKDAKGKQEGTGYAESGASGEADMYWYSRNLLKMAGVDVSVEGSEREYDGIKTKVGARCLLMPSFGVTQSEIKSRFTGNVKISEGSTLVLDGDITIKDLDLDGALIIKAHPGSKLIINSATIKNASYDFEPITDAAGLPEKYLIRGYTLKKTEELALEVEKGEHTVDITENKGGFAVKDNKLCTKEGGCSIL